MPVALNLAGQRIGNLLVLKKARRDKWGNFRWRCRCDCGAITKVIGTYLAAGRTQSCGCSRSRSEWDLVFEKLEQLPDGASLGIQVPMEDNMESTVHNLRDQLRKRRSFPLVTSFYWVTKTCSDRVFMVTKAGRRTGEKKRPTRICPVCSKPFIFRRSEQIFCSRVCLGKRCSLEASLKKMQPMSKADYIAKGYVRSRCQSCRQMVWKKKYNTRPLAVTCGLPTCVALYRATLIKLNNSYPSEVRRTRALMMPRSNGAFARSVSCL